jgi:CheY-like chemotaxis protein/HPt (histidine-containing phosphotransfer) domain-containing protein
MGGTINVESKKGEGTTVSFKVRFAKGSHKDLPFKEILSINKDMLNNKKILIVDDNNMNRLVAKTILNNYSAIITEAVNGKEAIDILETSETDLVLMDIQMPVMGGMEATKIIRDKISTTLPVIALTANAIKGDNEKCIEGGMNAYLSKPFKEEDLLQIVSFWLGGFKISVEKNLAIKSISDKPYDLSDLKAISRGNETFVMKMVNMFIEQTPVHVAEMAAKYHQNDFKGMAAIAHKIKPSIDNMGIVSLKETIRDLEKIGKKGIADAGIEAMLEMVDKNITQVINELQKEFEVVLT